MPLCLKYGKTICGRDLAQDPHGSLQRSPGPLAGGKGLADPSPKNPIPALGPADLVTRPFGERFTPQVEIPNTPLNPVPSNV